MQFQPETLQVTGTPQLGTIHMVHDDNNEKHFQWVNSTGIIELDLYLFKDDAVFQPVYQDRVFYLYFHSYEDKYFFWVKDEEEDMVRSINRIINLEDIEEEVQEM